MTLTKPRAIFLIALVILSLTILSAGISPRQFEYRGGGIGPVTDLISEQADSNPLNTTDPSSGYSIRLPQTTVQLLRFVIFWLILPASIVYSLFTKEGRSLLKRSIIASTFMAIIAFAFVANLADLIEGLIPSESETIPEVLYNIREMNPIILFLVSAVILIIVGGLGRLLYNHYIKPLLTPRTDFATTAQTALHNLEKGTSWQNAIIQCYADMSDKIKETKGLERRATVTPREFEAHLIQDGLPAQPIQHLTRLFEEARYNPESTNPTKANEAKTCLTAILSTLQPAQPAVNN